MSCKLSTKEIMLPKVFEGIGGMYFQNNIKLYDIER